MEILNLAFELIGTIAFAMSGAIVAIDKRMDILGVIVLGCTTAVGGGIIRDIILGNTPPQAFLNPIYIILATVVSVVAFIPNIRGKFQGKRAFDTVFLIMDAIGLGIFTVIGIEVAQNLEANMFLMAFVGVVTGVGGGLLRDIFSCSTPVIFEKHFYCSASIIGAIATVICWELVGDVSSMVIGTILIFILRMLAIRYKWKLPRA